MKPMRDQKIAMRLLNLPPIEFEKAVRRMKGDPQDISRWMNHLCERAAWLSEYIDEVHGCYGCGERSHRDAVKAANKRAVKVSKALGYSYPDRRAVLNI